MRIFLSGPMGSGKSTVARVLAARLGVRHVDLDAVIADTAGMSIEAIFRARGEAEFRTLERDALSRVLDTPADVVVALGGGTVTDDDARRALLGVGVLITLSAPVEELTARVAAETGRPLLAGRDARRVLEDLLARRGDAYAECHAEVETRGRSPEQVADAVLEVVRRAPIPVPLGKRTYRVDAGAGVRHRLAEEAAKAGEGRAALIATDDHVCDLWARPLSAELSAAGFRCVEVALAPGEEHKTIGSVERLWDAALEGGLDRDSLVVGIGGGVVGDLAGFAASTLLRGVSLGQVPTTLLAMVDSAVGGKTGFDRPQGKNLVGTFHQPRFVLCDVDVLGTLPDAERRAGLAEVVKSAWLDSEEAVTALERDAAALRSGEPEATVRAVRMAVSLKARIVTADEREAGPRRLLNLGHTVGHAIEAAAGYRGIRHGEAVALGMVAAFRVADRMGRKTGAAADRMRRLLEALGLPTDPGPRLDARAATFLASDKKRSAERVRFVVPGDPGCTEVVPITLDDLRAWLLPA